MKTFIQILKQVSLIIILVLISSFIQLGCKSQNSNKERSIIRNMESVFCLESPSLKPSINKSGIQNSDELFFNVKPTSIFKDKWQIDTVYTNVFDKNESNGSIVKEFEFQLSMDSCISVKRLEKLLLKIGINNCGLMEKLHWLRELTSARLITVKNNFGDVEGYYFRTKNGEIVPKNYYSLIKGTSIKSGDVGVGYSPEPIKLGAINQEGNDIRMYLKVINIYPKLVKPLIESPDDKAILISFNGKNTDINSKHQAIGLFIYITTKITFLKNGYISYIPQYTPFKIKQLN